jgi:hypothetical protein
LRVACLARGRARSRDPARRHSPRSSPSLPARTQSGHISPRTRRHPRQRPVIEKRPQTGRNRADHDPSPSGVSAPGVSCNEEVFGSSPKAGLPAEQGIRPVRRDARCSQEDEP